MNSARVRTNTLILLFLVTLLCIGLVWMTAQSSKIQYDINKINSEITNSEWTQRNLEAKIKGSNTLTNIEAEAREMGLVYPQFTDTVYLQADNDENQVYDLAVVLREAAHK